MSLEVNFRKHWKGFTLDVAFSSSGAPLGILGASGSGKSMTLKCIAGLVTPDDGEISLNGRLLFSSKKHINLKPQQRHIGYLFQNYALFPHMTVAQNLHCALAGSRAEKQAEAEKLLDDFRLGGLAQRYPAQLSGGQQQRVALARILASRPSALLLDEPFSALDEHLKETLQLEMGALLRRYEGDAVMVTHNRDEAYRLSENLLFLDAGKALLLGGTKAVFQNPGHLVAARLTGCKNFSRARAVGPHRVEALDWGCTLETAVPPPAGLFHIGVRAHYLRPAPAGAAGAIPVRQLQTIESPFEWNILFQCTAGEGQLWWKCPKAGPAPMPPAALAVSPEDVLLLVGD